MMGWITAIVGLVGAGASADASNKAGSAASGDSKKALQWQAYQYLQYQKTYGGIEENLADYYSNLSPDSYTAENLQLFEAEYATAKLNIEKDLARRGIEDSGLAASSMQDLEYQRAGTRAKIRYDAPKAVMAEKQSFLSGVKGNPNATGLSALLANQANISGLQANQAAAAAGESLQTALTTAGTAYADYRANKPAPQPTALSAGSTTAGYESNAYTNWVNQSLEQ